MRLDSNVELALLEVLEVVAEVRLVDAEDVSVDVEHEGEAWIVLDVTGSATVEAEKTGAWGEVVSEILVDAEVAVPWMSLAR